MRALINLAALAASCAVPLAFAGPLPQLNSAHAMVFDVTNQEVLLDKAGTTAVPIASITKVMTAMVALDAKPDMSETLSVSGQDVDVVKHSTSRVTVGTELSRQDALHLALMSSENRAASALSRHYKGGSPAFVRAMNEKARHIGMTSTRLADPTGLSPNNLASARDLVRMVLAAEHYKPITQFTTSSAHTLPVGARTLSYRNSNPLVGKPNWDIALSKTGYTLEAGRCIVMKMAAAGKNLVVVLLGSQSSNARLADIQSIRRWVSGGTQITERPPLRSVRTTEVRHAALIAAKPRTRAEKKAALKAERAVSARSASRERIKAAVRPAGISKAKAKAKVRGRTVAKALVAPRAGARAKLKIVAKSRVTAKAEVKPNSKAKTKVKVSAKLDPVSKAKARGHRSRS